MILDIDLSFVGNYNHLLMYQNNDIFLNK